MDVVERSAWTPWLMEMDMGDKSLLVDENSDDPRQAPRANTIVQGTVQDITKDTREFKATAPGVKTVITKGSVRIRVIDIQSGKLVASKIEDGEQKSTASQHGKKEKDDDAWRLSRPPSPSSRRTGKFLDS